MSRFLEADKVLVFKLYDDLTEEFYEKEFTIQNFIDTYAVDGCPQVVDAEPIQHGHWIGIDDEPWETYECDKCGYITEDIECNYGIPNNFKYCPSCGALMDEEVKE